MLVEVLPVVVVFLTVELDVEFVVVEVLVLVVFVEFTVVLAFVVDNADAYVDAFVDPLL